MTDDKKKKSTNKNKIFTPFLLLSGVLCLYFLTTTLSALHTYYRLGAQTAARISRWDIIERRGQFPITASYSFKIQETSWQGVHQFAPPWDQNELAAVHRLKELSQQALTVWFDPRHPQVSCLEKRFPYNSLFRCFTSLGVFFYLGWVFSSKKFNPA